MQGTLIKHLKTLKKWQARLDKASDTLRYHKKELTEAQWREVAKARKERKLAQCTINGVKAKVINLLNEALEI